jgi:hypothetical protein
MDNILPGLFVLVLLWVAKRMIFNAPKMQQQSEAYNRWYYSRKKPRCY